MSQNEIHPEVNGSYPESAKKMTDPQKQPNHPAILDLPSGWSKGVIAPGPVRWQEPVAEQGFLFLGMDGDSLHRADRAEVLLPKSTFAWATLDELLAYLEKVPRACSELGFPHGAGLIELCWVSGSAGNWVIEGTLVWAAFKEAPQAVPWLVLAH